MLTFIKEHFSDLVTLLMIMVLSVGFLLTRNKKRDKCGSELGEENTETAYGESSLIMECFNYITQAEELFKNTIKAGSFKKDSVLKSMQILCGTMGVSYDSEYWNKKVDDLVSLMKGVK